MAEIMGAFAHDLDNFVAYYEKRLCDPVRRQTHQYPRRGGVDTEVVTTGKLQISKKDFTKMTNRAAALLELFLHGFMQERKEMEAEQG